MIILINYNNKWEYVGIKIRVKHHNKDNNRGLI